MAFWGYKLQFSYVPQSTWAVRSLLRFKSDSLAERELLDFTPFLGPEIEFVPINAPSLHKLPRDSWEVASSNHDLPLSCFRTKNKGTCPKVQPARRSDDLFPEDQTWLDSMNKSEVNRGYKNWQTQVWDLEVGFEFPVTLPPQKRNTHHSTMAVRGFFRCPVTKKLLQLRVWDFLFQFSIGDSIKINLGRENDLMPIAWVVPPPSNSGKWRFIWIPY